MDLYEQYIKERENLDVIKTDRGFIFYRTENANCLIHTCFVLPEFRKDKHATFLSNQVFELCKEMGIKTVFCQTDESANGHQLSKLAIENFGFENYLKDGSLNHYKMEVSEWEAL